MQKFKVGDRIRETYSEDKDTGVITKPNPDQVGAWYVLWDEGSTFPGEELWLYEADMELLKEPLKFKVGDRVKEIKTGDCGIIAKEKEYYDGGAGWWINWQTGKEAGQSLHLREEQMEFAPEETEAPDLDGETIVLSGVEYRLTKI